MQDVRRAGGGDAAFLHRLEQRGLRLRRGAIDFVREQELGEDRPAAELELVAAVRPGGHDVRADDVRRHEVGRELDAAKIEIQRARERLHQLGLAEARHAFEQDVAARDDRREHPLDHALLADDDLPDGLAEVLKVFTKTLGFGLEFGGVRHGGEREARHRRTVECESASPFRRE